jgi:hypothetical protein
MRVIKQPSKPNIALRKNCSQIKTKQMLCVTLLAFALAACSGGSGGSADTGSSSGSTRDTGNISGASGTGKSPVIIDNEDRSAGLKGIDANNNGIRDDIDRLIAKKYSLTPAMKKSAEQEARALQKSLEAKNKIEARFAGDEIMRASNCSFKVFQTDAEFELKRQLSKEVEALTANTSERFKAYMEAEKLKNGMVFSQAEEPVCD